MRVAHILDSLNRGGAEMLELDVCRNAKSNGLDLIFIATGGGDLEEDFLHSGVEFMRLQRKLPIDLGLAGRLRKAIQDRDVNIVHSHQAVDALHVYLATRGTGVKTVLSHHGGSLDAKNQIALKFLVPLMDANIAVSQDLLEHLAAENKLDTSKNFFVLYNGVDNKRLRPAGGRALRGELGLAEGKILGMIANFYPGARKGQLTVCKSLPLFFSRTTAAHFAFIGGSSPAAPQVYDECVDFCRHAGISDRVHFLGKRADIPEVLHSLDLFVFSSLQEGGLPIAVIEAFMVGLPCLISDIGPLREVSGDGKYARLFEAGNAEDLARQLRELIDDSKSRARLGAQAREWAMQQFSIDTYLEILTRLYATLQPVA
ncbi:MAG: glycosyltransferase family 4 protein [Pyrinomonadaceae bacterium]